MADNAILQFRRSPAADVADELERGGGEAVRLREIPFLAQIGLRARPDGGTAALEAALGMPLPRGAGNVSEDGARHILWLSPDEFLFVAPDEADGGPAPAALADELTTALGGHPGQAIDLSANRTTLELSGPAARQVLQKSCQLDLHTRAFPVGTAFSTLLGTVGVILWRTEEDTWRVLPRASFTTHVARWLLDGMREFVP